MTGEVNKSIARDLPFKTTAELELPDSLIDQVIGQTASVEIIRLAAKQKRFVMLMGEPGTGKSMLGEALSELLPSGDLSDVMVFSNPDDPNMPKIKQIPAGDGEKLIASNKEIMKKKQNVIELFFWTSMIVIGVTTLYLAMTAASKGWLYYIGGIIGVGVLFYIRRFFKVKGEAIVPKLMVNNSSLEKAPFIDATGAHEGALFGDVRHDPYQSGGHETPQHHLVEAGAIHRAHGGVLYIDEVSTLSSASQQALLTAIQKKEFPIMGRSPGSSGSMVRTQPVPCDFVLILAGNLQDLESMHPALRSRVRGYGYEILTKEMIDDTKENHEKISIFVAQEVAKDKKIPHFGSDAVQVVIAEAHTRAGQEGKLTGKLRDLGGLVRAAGDIAVMEGKDLVEATHVEAALKKVKTLEEQIQEQKSEDHSSKNVQMPRASA